MTGFSAALIVALISLGSLALMGLEAFLPGLSLAGIAGSAIMIFALFVCLRAFGLPVMLLLLAVWLSAAVLIMRAVIRSMKTGKLSKSDMFLKTECAPTVHAADRSVSAGSKGCAHTPLRPSGIAVFDGRRVHVTADNGYIEKDERIVVVRTEGTRIIVKTDDA